MKFFIVTPTFNNLSWLKSCLRSVADQVQQDVEVHHHVQDGGSQDGTPEWLEQWQAEMAHTQGYRFTYVSGQDAGMYDAINLAWAQLPTDADITAHINSDEQYLPHALAQVAAEMAARPKADVLLGTYLILDAQYRYICHRRPVIPRKWSSWLNCACITNSSFYRASSFRKHQLAYDPHWKCVGDLVFFRELTWKKLRFETIPAATSGFLCTGQNLAWTGKAHEEWLSLHKDVPWHLLKLNQLIYRWVNFKRLAADWLTPAPQEFSMYTHADATERTQRKIKQPTARWGMRLEGEQ